jgi:hypothetical protein
MPTFSLLLKHAELDRRNAETIARIAQETHTDDREIPALSRLGDEKQLRGIPAIARGVTGAIPGSRPGKNLR